MKRNTPVQPIGLSYDHYCAVGMVAANWAALEAIISSAIWQIGEIPDQIGICLTSQIYTLDGKIKALITLLAVRGSLEKTISKVNKFHEELRGISDARNRTVHDPWVGDQLTGIPHRLQATANKTLVFELRRVPTADVYKLAEKISEMIGRFQTIISPAIEKYPALPILAESPQGDEP